MKFRTPYNYDHTLEKYESDFGPSITVPDQSLTVREILDRFVSGIAPPIFQDGSYDDDADFDDDDIRSFVDRTELEEQLTYRKENVSREPSFKAKEQSVASETKPVDGEQTDE